MTRLRALERRLPRTALSLPEGRAFRLVMVNDPHPDRPAGRDDRVQRIWPGPARARDAPPVLDLGFDLDTLHTARARVRAFLSRAGLPQGQAEDVVLAAHELAANAVSHGGGAGRLRVWNLAGALYCQVDDGDLLASARPGAGHDDIAAAQPEGSQGQASPNALPCEPGHGLWVVRQVADHVQSLSGPAGTSVLIGFDRGVTRPFA